EGVELELAPGDRLRLRGDAASGKSSLLEVLAGLAPVERGAVLVDGHDLRRADLGLVRDQVVLVRDAELLGGRLIDELRMLGGPLDEARARELLTTVGLEDAVDRLPQGLDTPLVPGGAPLSGSQTRRLVLARALAARPRALLLDGALDGLGLPDDRYQALLQQVLGPDAPWTAVVVSDDPRVSRWCDREARIDGFDLVEARS
ncbi:MAG: ABC transporter ATP-binding protein, partial [Myxococcales bacterium]|nr:ABC transporter ATP-binding protein [Myxococcales bacterium]